MCTPTPSPDISGYSKIMLGGPASADPKPLQFHFWPFSTKHITFFQLPSTLFGRTLGKPSTLYPLSSENGPFSATLFIWYPLFPAPLPGLGIWKLPPTSSRGGTTQRLRTLSTGGSKPTWSARPPLNALALASCSTVPPHGPR